MKNWNTIVRVLIIPIAFFILIPCTLHAQWYNPEKVSKKAKAIYLEAYDLASEGAYLKSLKKLDQAIKIYPNYVEAFLSRAGIYADLKNYDSSVVNFKTAFSLDSIFCDEYQLPYSISLAGIGRFDEALIRANNFLKNEDLNEQSKKSGKYRLSTYAFALAYKKNHFVEDYNFELINLGDSLNSNSLEYYPSLTIDGKKMIFTRRVQDDEDFYESDWVNNKWTKAVPAPGKINTNLNEGAQNISQDGNWLIFTGCNYPEGFGSCDLYISYKTKNGVWSEAENLGSTINTSAWESAPSLSPDKKDLYFSSTRSGGYGARDLWVTHRLPNGKWSTPENLGPEINTPGDESCPFIHSDNQTIYFNSNGHPGYGMTDLFLSRKDTANHWKTPENLGYPINTIDDEGSVIVASDGVNAYYASDRKEKNAGLDLYTFKLRKDIQASKTLWVNGNVFDINTKQGLPCTITLTELNSAKQISSIQTDESGNFLITLPTNKNYSLNINRKGYLFYSDNFSLIDNKVDSFFNLKIPLQPIEKGAAVVLKNIFFDSNSDLLKKESEIELDKFIYLLNENPNLKIQINGHTDNVGKKEDNQKLSLNRANAVIKYFVSKGIKAIRLTAVGYGDTKPIADNHTEQGKNNNRRTEINVISN
jgi:outer membrane protein OmpA-like peptidoglycan-associated protein/Tol biopolymer transport system component